MARPKKVVLDTQTTALDEQIAGTHYKQYKIQPAEFCQVNRIPFLESCVVKRMARHESKNGLEDLKKAIHEIRLIAQITYKEDI